jgi:hypothetical protein
MNAAPHGGRRGGPERGAPLQQTEVGAAAGGEGADLPREPKHLMRVMGGEVTRSNIYSAAIPYT